MSWWKQRTRLSGLICILFTFSEFASFHVLTVCLFVPLWSNSIQLPLLQIRSRGWIIFWNLSLPENHETIKWAELDFERRPLRWRGETLRTNAWEESPIRFCPRSRPFWKRESVKDILQHGPRVEEKKKKREKKIWRSSTAGHPVDHLPRAIQQHYLHVPNFLRRIWPSAWYDLVNSQSGAVLGSISDWSVIMATMQQKESFITDGIRDECSRRNQL